MRRGCDKALGQLGKGLEISSAVVFPLWVLTWDFMGENPSL